MRRMILGLAVAVLAAGIARADEKADAILKKAIEAHGGKDALTKYGASRASMKGEMAVMGSDVAFTGKMAYSYPQQYSLEVNLEFMGQKILVNQVVNGEKVKATVKVGDMTIDQTKEQEPEAKFKLLLQEASAFFPLLDKKKFEVKAEPDEDVAGSKASVLIVTPVAIKREFKLYIDQKTGLLVKSSYRGPSPSDPANEALQEAYHQDYKKVNGIQVATKIVVKVEDKKFMTVELSDIETLEKIEASEFKVGE